MSTELGPAARHYGRRADAERNRESVLDHAGRLLAEDPAIGMSEIATAAGIGRATLYRHFPTREELIEAIGARAIDETDEAIAASRLDEGTTEEALHRLVLALLEIGDRYRFLLMQEAQALSEGQFRAHEERLGTPVFALIERGQAAGELSPSLPPSWIANVLGAVILTALQEVAAGRLDPDRAPRIVTDTLLHGTSCPAAPGCSTA
jgi:AcrR family transcriptional regulator